MKSKSSKTVIAAVSAMGAAGISVLVWWITRRNSERCLIGASGSGNHGNILTYAVQAVIDKGRRVLGMKYFTINELTRSAKAKELGIDNTPSAAIRAKLEALVVNCLDPVRTIYGKPIIVTSGYRCEALNEAVNGVSGSQHTKGEAADIVPASGGRYGDMFRAAVRFGDFDQMILEEKGNSRWVHISWRETNRRHRILLYRNGIFFGDITNTWQTYV